jgi:Protein of unknown function (DUF4231)
MDAQPPEHSAVAGRKTDGTRRRYTRLHRPIEAVLPADPTWERLEDHITWCDRKSGDNQRLYRWLKLLEIAVAVALPVVAAVHSPVWVTGGLASVIVVLEGVQQVHQFQQNWITYRSTQGPGIVA